MKKMQSLKNEKRARLIDWVIEMLSNRLQEVIVHRHKTTSPVTVPTDTDLTHKPPKGVNPLDEFAEVITLPDFDGTSTRTSADSSDTNFDPVVSGELRDFVTAVSSRYRDNAFHNFDHACHVTMAANKLLQRIVAPGNGVDADTDGANMASKLHYYTHGITSDHLTMFAIVFSALIHVSQSTLRSAGNYA